MFVILRFIIVLSVLVFIVGLLKPQWVLFWHQQPSRFLIMGIALVVFMGGFTGLAELQCRRQGLGGDGTNEMGIVTNQTRYVINEKIQRCKPGMAGSINDLTNGRRDQI